MCAGTTDKCSFSYPIVSSGAHYVKVWKRTSFVSTEPIESFYIRITIYDNLALLQSLTVKYQYHHTALLRGKMWKVIKYAANSNLQFTLNNVAAIDSVTPEANWGLSLYQLNTAVSSFALSPDTGSSMLTSSDFIYNAGSTHRIEYDIIPSASVDALYLLVATAGTTPTPSISVVFTAPAAYDCHFNTGYVDAF